MSNKDRAEQRTTTIIHTDEAGNESTQSSVDHESGDSELLQSTDRLRVLSIERLTAMAKTFTSEK